MSNTVTSDEVNYLVFRYLQESGYVHSAFAFGYESHIIKTNIDGSQVPPGALLSFLQRGLSYVEIESSLADSMEGGNDGVISLLDVHRCLADKSASGDVAGENGDVSNGDGNAGGNSVAPSADTGGKAGAAGIKSEGERQLLVPDIQTLVLRGHSSEVFVCAWNPRTNVLASGSGDSTARIWTVPSQLSDSTSSTQNPIILRHANDNGSSTAAGADGAAGGGGGAAKSNDVTTIDWSPDGTKLATGSYDGLARIWSENGELLHVLSQHKCPLFTLKWNRRGDYLLSGSVDKMVVIWKASTGKALKQYAFHTAPTLGVDWRDDTSFASCSSDKRIFVCKYGEDSPVYSFSGHQDEINAIKWDPSGSLLASCSDDCTAKVWSVGVEHPVHDFREHTKEISTERWCPSTTRALTLATASFDATVKLWDVNTGQCVSTLAKHTEPVYTIAFSQDGNYLASGSFDKRVHIWSVKDGSVVRTYQGDGGVFEVGWNHQDDKIAACFSNGALVVVDAKSGLGSNAMNIG